MSQDRSRATSLAARWVLPIAADPIYDGVVRIAGGRIVEVRQRHSHESVDHDLGEAVLLPAFANPHTHLDLSNLEGNRPPTTSLTEWLEQIVVYRRSQPPQSSLDAVHKGLVHSIRSGVLTIGDVSAGGNSWTILSKAPVRAVVYYEVLGLSPDRAAAAWSEFERWLDEHRPTLTCRPGVSPHAPYSTHRTLFERAARCDPQVPIAVHIAESDAERQLLETREGSFVAFLQALGVWEPAGLMDNHRQLLEMFRDRSESLWVHANYLGSLAPLLRDRWVVWCPRTHAAFGHRPYPLDTYHAAGVHVAIGTDSLASNPGLDLLGELRHVHSRYSQVSPQWLIRQATLGNAAALGWHHETGSFETGKSADLIAATRNGPIGDDPYLALLDPGTGVTEVISQGRWLVREGQMTAELENLTRP